jgi:putative hydrolase of the HAD superfamily
MDDTLYPEVTFVYNGFRNVAEFLKNNLGLEEDKTFKRLVEIFEDSGRGSIFNILLREQGLESTSRVNACIKAYRHGKVEIELTPGVAALLRSLSKSRNLYLVTDGNKMVQARKVEALNLRMYFRRIFITHRYGVDKAKPSLHCFEKIARLEGVELSDLVYVADDPHKDFVNLNRAGAKTVRVLTGRFKDMKASPEFDAQYKIAELTDISKILKVLEQEPN